MNGSKKLELGQLTDYLYITALSLIAILFSSGETCDIHYKNRDNFLIGEDIMRPGDFLGRYMRNMCEPKAKGSIYHMDQYNDDVDVHATSGVYNKAWCTLVNTAGWDYIKAFEVRIDSINLPTHHLEAWPCAFYSTFIMVVNQLTVIISILSAYRYSQMLICYTGTRQVQCTVELVVWRHQLKTEVIANRTSLLPLMLSVSAVENARLSVKLNPSKILTNIISYSMVYESSILVLNVKM